MTDWNPALYLEFERERTQPAIDLAQRVSLASPATITDLGCGPGNSTSVLRRRWSHAAITAVDSSPDMIRQAAATDPAVTWTVADAAAYTPSAPPDLIYSNAMLHWLHHHDAVCDHWFRQLAPGGVLAVQVPAHHDSTLHRQILEVSRDPRWDTLLAPARAAMEHHPPAFYYDLFTALGAARIDLWETTYHQTVDSPEAVIRWFRGTGLRPYLDALSHPADRALFEARLLERYRAAYPTRADGRVLFPFNRLFFIATRPGDKPVGK